MWSRGLQTLFQVMAGGSLSLKLPGFEPLIKIKKAGQLWPALFILAELRGDLTRSHARFTGGEIIQVVTAEEPIIFRNRD